MRRCAGGLTAALFVACAGCEPPPAGEALLPAGAIECLTDTGKLLDLAFQGRDTLWAASPGGLLRLDIPSGKWTVLTMASGLPSNRVLCLLATSGGDLWVGTDRGAALSRAAGFTVYGEASGLPSPVINVLEEGADGTIYAGTEKGIARFREGGWEPFNDTHEFARRAVRGIARDLDGSLWFAKDNSLTHFLGDRWETFQKDSLSADQTVGLISNSLLSAAVDRRGTKWFGTAMGLNSFDGRRWESFYYHERMTLDSGLQDNRIESVAAGGGLVWVAHGHSRDFDVPPGLAFGAGDDRWTYLSTADGLPSSSVYKLRAGPGGEMWAATGLGAASIKDGRVTPHPTPRELPGNHVVSLFGGGEGRFYALLDGGLAEVSGAGAIVVSPRPAQGSGAAAWSGGTLYLAPLEGGLLTREGDGPWKQESGFKGIPVLSLEIDERGGVLAAAADGLHLGRAGSWETVPLAGTPPGFRLLRAFPGPGGSLWITGACGKIDGGAMSAVFFRRQGRFLPALLPPEAAPYARLNRIIFDGRGEAWLVSPSGLYRRGKEWEEVRLPIRRGSLWEARWDALGGLWAADRDGGLFLGRDGGWLEIRPGGNAAPAGITSILRGGDGRLWLGTADQGLLGISLPPGLSPAAGRAEKS